MTLQELVDEIGRQPIWQADGKRAPHKPLTLLYALGQAMRGNRIVRYADAEKDLIRLLDRFGHPRATPHPEQPVWRLHAYQGTPTRFWEIVGDTNGIEGAKGNPSSPRMRARIAFGLSGPAWAALSHDATSAQALAQVLADEIVPRSLQPALLDAVGVAGSVGESLDHSPDAIDPALLALVSRRRVATTRTERDPTFSRRVLEAYGRACAICAISPRLGTEHFGLEAAHIRWVRYDGPDVTSNGLCLCKMHHEALDWGAVKIDHSMKVCVSSRLDRSPESEAMFGRFEGKEIRLPRSASSRPSEEMLQWHWDEVFKP
jgi:putative restriction endonuclease